MKSSQYFDQKKKTVISRKSLGLSNFVKLAIKLFSQQGVGL